MARFTTHELKALANFSYDTGYGAYYDTDQDQKPTHDANLEQGALQALATSTLLAAHSEEPDAHLVWNVNFARGWHYAEAHARKYQEATIEIPGLEASDAEDEAETEEDGGLTGDEMEHLCLLFHGHGDDLAYDEGGLVQAEVERRALQEIQASKLLAPFADVAYVRNHLVLNFWRGYHFQRTNDADYEKPQVDGHDVF